MDANGRSTIFALTILLAVFLQVIFVWADNRQSPNEVAVSFAEAYFKLDESMGRFLCSEWKNADEGDIVEAYVYRAVNEVNRQGFDRSWAKSTLYGIETHTLERNPDGARIRLTAMRRKSINPVFAAVAKLFDLGEESRVDEIVELTREDGGWKVCSPVFELTRT